jgi:hypothetical protein
MTMDTVSGARPHTARENQQRKGKSPPFRAIGIPAVAAAALNQPKRKPAEVLRELPPILRKENFED